MRKFGKITQNDWYVEKLIYKNGGNSYDSFFLNENNYDFYQKDEESTISFKDNIKK